MSYNLDTNKAKKADQYGGQISKIGAYTGVFTNVYETTSALKGTKGIVFEFKSDENQTAEFSLWVMNKQGEELFGMDAFHALMACAKVRNCNPVQGTAKIYDKQSNSRIDRPAQVIPELINKHIGIMFETEDYEKNNGDIGTKIVFAMPFDADGKFTASEILNQATEAKTYYARLETLKHRLVRGVKSTKQTEPQTHAQSADKDMEDDIPFN